jgi:anti-anti-sigma factor
MPSPTDTPTLPLVEIRVTGPLDAAATVRMQPLLADAVALRPNHLVVDLSECDTVDAAGIGLLVDAHRAVWRDGGRMSLQGVSPRVHRVLEIARVDRVLQTSTAPPGYRPRHRPRRRATTPASPVVVGEPST